MQLLIVCYLYSTTLLLLELDNHHLLGQRLVYFEDQQLQHSNIQYFMTVIDEATFKLYFLMLIFLLFNFFSLKREN